MNETNATEAAAETPPPLLDLKIEGQTFTLKPCPCCGHQPWEVNVEFTVHPLTRSYDLWTGGCPEDEGGCGLSVTGDSAEHVIALWNNRTGKPLVWSSPYPRYPVGARIG